MWKRGSDRSRTAAPEVYNVTGAHVAHSDDLDERVRRYLISMGVRTACVVLAVVVAGPARWVFIVGAVVLPYVAVVMANSGRKRRPAGPGPLDAPQRKALPGNTPPLPRRPPTP